MTFSKGPYSISITRMTDKEKRPGLYVGSMNKYCYSYVKVGTFSNDSRAEDFCRMLQVFFGYRDSPYGEEGKK